jgi:soluble lytic murein transglycosylase-like protein
MNRIRPSRITWAVAAICVVAVLALPASASELARLRNGFTIRHEHRAAVGENTRLFLSVDNSSYVDVPTAEIEGFEKDFGPPPKANSTAPGTVSGAKFNPSVDQAVNSASATYHLDPDLVNSVIRAESGFNTRAVSRKGAQGLMQLMPATASRMGVADVFDPLANVGGGSRYLRELMERYNFDLIKALAAYNAGPEKVELFRGVPPYHETRAYVARIVHDYNKKKIAEEKQAAAAPGASKRGQQAGISTAPPQSPR